MPPLFKPRSTAIFRLVLLAGFGGIAMAGIMGEVVKWSTFMTEASAPLEQPVPFSHEHHVSGLGLDCRYCHNTVEHTATAGMPATHVCMTCHSQIWTDAKILEPVRASLSQGKPLRWNRVYRIPKYVYFNHGIHVSQGIGCSECHGRVDKMPITYAEKPFYMRVCLDCHREPERFIRPRDEVFNMAWEHPANQLELGRRLVSDYHIPTQRLTDCVTCHR